jgi:hypothetical protein
MSELVYRRNSCRICEKNDLDLVLKLTPTPPVDAFISADHVHKVQETFPLDLFLCRSCGHAQLLDVVAPKVLFGNYIYETASSPGLVEHFRKYADEVVSLLNPAQNALVVDVGSNDGTLLRFFKEKGMRVLGIDPATEIGLKATQVGIETIPAFFGATVGREVKRTHGPAAVITANNVFAHADNLGDMANGVRDLLASDGVFVFEVSYLLDMIDGMVFDFIYHEHLSYHSIKPLDIFLRRHGLEMVNISKIPTKGGSIRVMAQQAGGPLKRSPSVDKLIELEEGSGLNGPDIFRTYSSKINRVRDRVQSLLGDLTRKNKTIAGYGASATGTVLLYHFNLGEKIQFIVDDNQSRQGLFSPGFHIPVLSPQVIYERKPGCVVILAWRFADMIVGTHKSYLDQGGHFLVPLPEARII